MPWSSGCSFDVVFGGRYLTLMLDYSFVMCGRALSTRRRMCLPVSHSTSLTNVQTQQLSLSHCCCGNNQLLKSLRPKPFVFRTWGHAALLIISGGSLSVPVMLVHSMILNLSLELRYFEPLTVSALIAYVLLARACRRWSHWHCRCHLTHIVAAMASKWFQKVCVVCLTISKVQNYMYIYMHTHNYLLAFDWRISLVRGDDTSLDCISFNQYKRKGLTPL